MEIEPGMQRGCVHTMKKIVEPAHVLGGEPTWKAELPAVFWIATQSGFRATTQAGFCITMQSDLILQRDHAARRLRSRERVPLGMLTIVSC